MGHRGDAALTWHRRRGVRAGLRAHAQRADEASDYFRGLFLAKLGRSVSARHHRTGVAEPISMRRQTAFAYRTRAYYHTWEDRRLLPLCALVNRRRVPRVEQDSATGDEKTQ